MYSIVTERTARHDAVDVWLVMMRWMYNQSVTRNYMEELYGPGEYKLTWMLVVAFFALHVYLYISNMHISNMPIFTSRPIALVSLF